MKKTTKLKAIVLSLMMLIGLIPLTSFAQQRNDDYFRSWENDYDNRTSVATWTLTNQTFGEAPLGSGLLILTAVGAGYAISRRKRSRKGIMMILVLAMILSFTQCKKNTETITPVSGEKVHITLKVGGGSRHDVNTATGEVTYAAGDKIYVGNDGKYIGTLTCSKVGEDFVFGGDITDPKATDYLHFYFVGGLAAENIYPAGSLTAGTTTSFTVDISDQSSKLPVLSYVHTAEYYDGGTSYTCMLLNKCALVKFTTSSTSAPVHVGGLYTVAQIDFANNSITNNGTKGFIALGSGSTTEKWAILLPQTNFSGAEGVIADKGYTITMPDIVANAYLTDGVAISTSSTPSHNRYLQWAVGNLPLENGDRVYGTLSGNYQISIADGATVTLDEMSISYAAKKGNWAGLTCLGDATIVLADGTTNTVVSGFDSDGYNNWPGIYVPQNKTLTINGNTGILNARCGQDSYGGSAAGIGCGFKSGSDCGNIIINGGVINARGGAKSAGIGGVNKRSCGSITINGGTVTAIGDSYGSDTGYGAGIGTGGSIVGTATVTCGDITITGGTVTATGGRGAAGIGTGHSGQSVAITCGNITISGGTVIATGGGDADLGYEGAAAIGTGNKENTGTVDNKCGDITITTGVTRVTATKGSSNADNSIGTSGSNNICGTITIGGVVTGNISTSPYTYVP